MIVLDCTLRDGGYHNNWEFPFPLANEYLIAMEKSKIDAIEVGFRNPYKPTKGVFASLTDYVITLNLYIPKVKYFGVMIDASSMTTDDLQVFNRKDESHINFVRMAIHFRHLPWGEVLCKELKDKGYTVCCNLMQAAGKSYEEIANAAKMINKWNAVDVLYLADSLGGMDHDAIDYAFSAIKEEWDGMTGFHAHNNKGQALNNTLEAVDIGVDWVDGTILGMGRGAGNTETEYLLREMNKRGFGEYITRGVNKLALNQFAKLRDYSNWGPSLPYFLGAEYDIHPTYIQTLLSKHWNPNFVLDIIYSLSYKEANSFSNEILKECINECRNNNTSEV